MRSITSVQNPELKSLVRLKDRRDRERERLFLIEGARELTRAVEGNVALRTLYVCPELLSPDAHAARRSLEDVAGELVELSRAAFEKVSHRENPDGLLAVAPIPGRGAPRLPESPLVLVVVGVEKPGNLGALLRTADGVGVDAVVVAGRGVDLYSPNVIRASQGSVFTLPTVVMDDDEALGYLTRERLTLCALTPEGADTYWDADLRGRLALALGTEHAGLPDRWKQAAGQRLSIPMRGHADSLNVATAGALVLYEALRQRAR